jgi:hypothetical protein
MAETLLPNLRFLHRKITRHSGKLIIPNRIKVEDRTAKEDFLDRAIKDILLKVKVGWARSRFSCNPLLFEEITVATDSGALAEGGIKPMGELSKGRPCERRTTEGRFSGHR